MNFKINKNNWFSFQIKERVIWKRFKNKENKIWKIKKHY